MPTNIERLNDLFKDQVASQTSVLQEALTEITKEQGEQKKENAKKLIKEALALQDQMNQAERQFNSQKKKWDKSLGKVLNRLQNMASGKPVTLEDEEEEEKDQP
jgi:hypothetical protein